MNHVLISTIGDVGVNAFSIISCVASFAMSVMYGTAEGLQPPFGQSDGAKDDKELKYYFRSGMLLTLAGSIIIFLATLFFGGPISALFGADADVLEFTVKYMPQYSWGFMIAGLNTLMTAYLYSTKHSSQALVVNILRSFVLNTLIVLGLPAIFFGSIIWHTFGIFESVLLIITISVVRFSERNGIRYR